MSRTRTAAGKLISRARSVALRAALVAVAFGLGAVLLFAPSDNASLSKTVAAPTVTADPSAAPRTPRPTPRSTATPNPVTPTPSPPPATPAPEGVAAGGDQPSGPLPDTTGRLPDVVNASAEMLDLLDRLAGEIQEYDRQVGGIDVAIAVTDMQTDEIISYNGNSPHRTGCTIMMFALLAAVGEFQAGRADPGPVAYSIRRGIGGSYPPEVRRMLDTVFGSYITGTLRTREMMAGWGMRTSFFDHVPYYGGEYPAPNILTALETNDIFVRLYRGQLFDPTWTAYSLQKLTEIAGYLQYILPGRLPASTTVIHKIGYYADYDGWVNNDAGIVTFTGADGTKKAYAISYFSQMARTEYIGYSFGARLSRVVWDYMAGKYGVWTPPTPPPTPVPEPTPQPTPTPAPTPEPTPSPTPSPSPSPAPSPSQTPSPAPSATPGNSTPTPITFSQPRWRHSGPAHGSRGRL